MATERARQGIVVAEEGDELPQEGEGSSIRRARAAAGDGWGDGCSPVEMIVAALYLQLHLLHWVEVCAHLQPPDCWR